MVYKVINSIFAQILKMGLNSIMKIFMPKDRVFYSLFEEVVATVYQMGKSLKDVVAEPDFDKRAGIISKLEDSSKYCANRYG